MSRRSHTNTEHESHGFRPKWGGCPFPMTEHEQVLGRIGFHMGALHRNRMGY